MDTFDRERELAYLTRVVPDKKNIPAMVAIYELVYERGLTLRGPDGAIDEDLRNKHLILRRPVASSPVALLEIE